MKNTIVRRYEKSNDSRADMFRSRFARLGLSAILIALVSMHLSCSEKSVQGDRYFQISGTVIDFAGSQKIDSAIVYSYHDSTVPDSVLTDSSGTFRFQFLTGGSSLKNVRILASKAGFVTFDTLITVLKESKVGWVIGLDKSAVTGARYASVQ